MLFVLAFRTFTVEILIKSIANSEYLLDMTLDSVSY